MRKHTLALLAATAAIMATAVPALTSGSEPRGAYDPRKVVDLQILALNDFHGNLQSPGTVTLPDGTRRPAGGADVLASYIRAKRAENDNTAFVSAGDLIGASPLISALFRDEPTIEAMNLMGLDFNAVGNHEFDRGADELLRMQRGGCHPTDGCLDGDGFSGASFKFLAANVKSKATGKTIFPSYAIKRFEKGVRVAFVGMTLEGTPTIVTPSGVAGLEFNDEADTVNALVRKLKRRADIVVVLIHEGGVPSGPDFNACPGISGPIVDIVKRTSKDVDLFITGHTHQGYVCNIDGRPVTSSLSFGRLVTDIDIQFDRKNKRIVGMGIQNVPVLRDTGVLPAADVVSLIGKYDALSAPLRNRVIGSATADLLRAANAAGESPLGDVIADSQLAATADPARGGAVVAFMNPGGIRADVNFAQASGGEQPGQVTYGEVFTVQPFGNSLVTMTLTGAQLDALLEQQWTGVNAAAARILQVSKGFTYEWKASAPAGSRVDAASIKINGQTVSQAGSYRVTVNSFLADGGDGFTTLTLGTARLGGAQDLDALEAYFKANSPVPPGPANRLVRIP